MNDLLFMMMPFVDNFWHTQCTVMLTPRLPLYIPCVYVVFMYVGVAASNSPFVSSRLLAYPSLGRSSVAALTSGLFYSLYDLVGAKYLWWSWHTTDAATYERWLGVPFGSTLWTIVHVFCFSMLLHWSVFEDGVQSGGGGGGGWKKGWSKGLMFTGFLATPMMMIAMGPFQLHQLIFAFDDKGYPTIVQQPGKPGE